MEKGAYLSQHVREWCKEFSEGCTEIHDKDRSGRPSVSDGIIEKVESIMVEECLDGNGDYVEK